MGVTRPIGRARFADWFVFARPGAAPVTDATGAVIAVPANGPRFDHAPDGRALGLLVEPGDRLGAADRVRLADDALTLAPPEKATVLHQLLLDGAVDRRALYSLDARATCDAALAGAGHHQALIVLAGHVAPEPETGKVRFAEADWRTVALLSAGGGRLFADRARRPILGG